MAIMSDDSISLYEKSNVEKKWKSDQVRWINQNYQFNVKKKLKGRRKKVVLDKNKKESLPHITKEKASKNEKKIKSRA